MLDNYLRLRSLLTPSPPIGFSTNHIWDGTEDQEDEGTTTSVVNDEKGNDRTYDVDKVYNKLVGSDAPPAQKTYRDFLQTQPSREDYKPSKTARIAAILGGVSEGVQHGAGAGLATTNSVLDAGYNDAISDYKLKADRLGTAANIEEKDIGNRVKTYRDIIQDIVAERKAEEDKRLHDTQIKNYDSLIKDRDTNRNIRGWNYFTDPKSGTRIGVRPNANGTFDKLDVGQGGLSITDRVALAGKEAGARSNATLANNIELAKTRGEETRKNVKERFTQAKELVKFKNDNPTFKFETLSDGSIVAIDPKDPYNIQHTGLNSGKLSDAERSILQLKNAKELKQTPGPNRTTTTTISDDGKRKTTTTTSSGKIRMVDPNGKVFMIDPKEKDEAIKHFWKEG